MDLVVDTTRFPSDSRRTSDASFAEATRRRQRRDGDGDDVGTRGGGDDERERERGRERRASVGYPGETVGDETYTLRGAGRFVSRQSRARRRRPRREERKTKRRAHEIKTLAVSSQG